MLRQYQLVDRVLAYDPDADEDADAYGDPGHDDAVNVLLALAGCNSVAGPLPGTVEYAAATVSRAYDCGLRVDRGGILARLDRQDRQHFVEANARYAVKSYKAPHRCDTAERERVLDRFYRAPHPDSSPAGGSGLGLAIVRAVAQLHGARLLLDEAPQLGGLRVSVELPADVRGVGATTAV